MAFDRKNFDQLQAEVLNGRLNRRDVLKRSLALGLSAPAIATLLAACGGDDDDDSGDETSTEEDTGGDETATEASTEEATDSDSGTAEGTEAATEEGDATEEGTAAEEGTESEQGSAGPRGGGGKTTLLYWQAPVIMNPHLATGTKDFHASRVCLEPLFDLASDLSGVLQLATEWPTFENELLDPEGMFVIWKLREGVKWHDGEDFNAEDVVFTWQFITNPETTATTLGDFANVESVEAIDDYTVQINFANPEPYWYNPFGGSEGLILPEHIFRDYMGPNSMDAPANLMPIGTGPYKVREFRPGDVILFDLFEDYWEEGKPFFDEIELKGGGDAVSAARAVLQTGEADWAWNLQIEPQVLEQLEAAGQGELSIIEGAGGTERLMIQFADPRTEVDGAFAEPTTEHPLFKDKRIRKALDVACPRDVIAEQLYGRGGKATAHVFDEPAQFVNPDITWEFDLEKAKALLDEAGFEGFDLLYQTSVNSVRQKHQQILKEQFEQLGFTVELKTIDSAIYFSADPGNPDTTSHFYADLEMYTNSSGPYPVTWAERYRTDEIAQKSNNWSKSNYYRYSNPEYDKLHDQARVELEVEKQKEIFHQMWAIVKEDVVDIPQVARHSMAAKHKRITGDTPSAWASVPVYDLKNWRLAEE